MLSVPSASSIAQQPVELREIIGSKLFERSTTLCSLLLYLWDHRHEDISEYAIAIDALGRKTSFDPKHDSTVRVHISRLRKRLQEFYRTEGSHLRSRIEIPMGTHSVRIIEIEQPDLQAPVPTAEDNSPLDDLARGRYLPPGGMVFIALLLALCVGGGGVLFWQHAYATRFAPAASSKHPLSAFWQDELGNGKQTRIVVPSPTFFLWNNASTDQLLARDPDVNDFSQLNDSARLTALKKEYGRPQLNQAFILATDAFGLMRLTRYFDSYGIPMPVYATSDSPATVLDHENMIVLGNYRNLAPYRAYIDRLTLKMDPRQVAVIDEKPLAGHPHRFDSVRESPTRAVTPGIIAVLPGANAATRLVIIMASFDTSSLANYLTSSRGLRELEDARRKQGNSPYFEAVILTEVNGEVRLKSWLAELKSISPGR